MVPGGNNLTKAIFQATREGLKVTELAEAEQTKPIVFLDMDGVIADFFSEYAKMAGVEDGNYRKIPRNKINPTLNAMKGTDFFNRLPKIATADQLTKMAVSYTGGDYSILSSPLRGDKDNSARWKKVWLAREMQIQPRNVIITSNKAAYAKSNGIANILIDDHGSNIQKWNAAGGHGIKYQADEDSLETVKRGLEAYETDRLDKRSN
jgi:5'(3')-deoxyribonucleotidase